MGPTFRLSLRQLASRRRLLLILVLAALPIGLAAIVSATLDQDETANKEFINTLLDALLTAGIVPIVTMVLATAAFGNELEDRTLGYLTLKPISRLSIVFPKLLASVVVSAPLLIVSGVGATLLGASSLGAALLALDSTFQAAVAVGVALLVGVITYAAIFTWAGLISTRALAFALVYVFLWEGAKEGCSRSSCCSVPCPERVPPLILRSWLTLDAAGSARTALLSEGTAWVRHEDKQFLDEPFHAPAELGLIPPGDL